MGGLLLLVLLAQAGPNASKLAEGEVLRTSALYQVVDSAGMARLEIKRETELEARKAYRTRTVFTLPSGEGYTLLQNMTYNPSAIDDSFEFPDHQKLVLTGRAPSKAPDATSTKRQRPPDWATHGVLSFGKQRFNVDFDRDAEGEFAGKEGQKFRESLPPLPDDLIDALSNLKHDEVCEKLGLCGTASTFFEAYRDNWLKDKDNAWELKLLDRPGSAATPTPRRSPEPSEPKKNPGSEVEPRLR